MKSSSSNNTPEASKQESTSNEDQLVERVPIENTPFTAIKFDGAWFLTMGKYRLTDATESLEAIKEDAQRADWTRVMQIVQIVVDENKTAWMKEVADAINKHNGHTTNSKAKHAKSVSIK